LIRKLVVKYSKSNLDRVNIKTESDSYSIRDNVVSLSSVAANLTEPDRVYTTFNFAPFGS
jgi:hypothetical protein